MLTPPGLLSLLTLLLLLPPLPLLDPPAGDALADTDGAGDFLLVTTRSFTFRLIFGLLFGGSK